jgi:hypothetical protein
VAISLARIAGEAGNHLAEVTPAGRSATVELRPAISMAQPSTVMSSGPLSDLIPRHVG